MTASPLAPLGAGVAPALATRRSEGGYAATQARVQGCGSEPVPDPTVLASTNARYFSLSIRANMDLVKIGATIERETPRVLLTKRKTAYPTGSWLATKMSI